MRDRSGFKTSCRALASAALTAALLVCTAGQGRAAEATGHKVAHKVTHKVARHAKVKAREVRRAAHHHVARHVERTHKVVAHRHGHVVAHHIEVRHVASGDESMQLHATDRLDPRSVALVEQERARQLQAKAVVPVAQTSAPGPRQQIHDDPIAQDVGDPVPLRSGSALVIDARTNQVLLSKNAGEVRPIASLTKLMTAAVTLDAHLPMDAPIEITDADVDTLKWSSSRLRPGVVLPREELLRLALMSSENRAAHALARTYPGGLTAFVAAMNRKAQSLGMDHTHYEDPTGLTPRNQSTAHDLALLVKDVRGYPLIRQFSTDPKGTVVAGRRELQYRNTDHLIFNRGWDILLQKTGYINEAGHCLVLNTVVQGRNVIVVLLDAWGKYSHFGDAERIRNWMQTSGRTMLSRVDALPDTPTAGTTAVNE